MLRNAWLLLWLGLLTVVLTTAAHAGDLREQIDELFKLSTKASPSALQAARAYYEKISAKGSTDARVDYAFALVLIEQQRLGDAEKKLDDFLKSHPNDLHARRARIWVQLMRREDQAALAGLESLAELLGIPSDEPPSRLRKDMAEFLGRAIAFLEGPVASTKLDKPTAAAKERLIGLVKQDELLADCERGYFQVDEKFEILRADVTAAKSEATIQQTAAIQKHEELADKEQAALAEKHEAIQESLDEQTAETKQEVDDVQAKLIELRKSYSDLIARAVPLQMQVNAAKTEISSQTLIEQQPDGSHLVTYRNPFRVKQLEGILSQLEIQLAPLNAAAAAINARVMTLQQKGRNTLLQHEQERQNLTNQRQALATKGKKLERIAKLAKPKATGNNVKTRVLATKLATFSTYDRFPLEDEKARILHSLK